MNQLSETVFATFTGNIETNGINRIFAGISRFTQLGVKKLHLLFQSHGGTSVDGIAVYNYFQNCPLELTLYNSGSVGSAAAIAYLGAPIRKVSPLGYFIFHSIQNTFPQPVNAIAIRNVLEGVDKDDANIERVMRDHLTLTDDEWETRRRHDLIIDALRAKDIGLAHEIADFHPKGLLYNF